MHGTGELWWHDAAQLAGVDPEQLATCQEDEPEPEPATEPTPDLGSFLQAVIAEAAALGHTTPPEPVEQAHAALEAQRACFNALAAFEARVASRLGKSAQAAHGASGKTHGNGSSRTSRLGKESVELRGPGVHINNSVFAGNITPSCTNHM